MKAPLLMRKILLLGIYPSIYIMWVNLMKNTWVYFTYTIDLK